MRTFIASAAIAVMTVVPAAAQSNKAVDCSAAANAKNAECVNLPKVSSQSVPANLLPILIGVGGIIVVGALVGGGDDDDSTGSTN